VYGDTDVTLGAALTAVKLGVGVGHVEAGLRSEDRWSSESVNRIVNDRLSSLLLYIRARPFRCHSCGWRGWLQPLQSCGTTSASEATTQQSVDLRLLDRMLDERT
jgi:hypothetical protein